MKTRVLAMTGMALFVGVSALPAVAAPVFPQAGDDGFFMLAANEEKRAASENARDQRKPVKQPARKAETPEREREEPDFGYGYERRNSPPERPEPGFGRR